MNKTGMSGTVDYVFDTEDNVIYEQENRNYLEYIYVLGKHFARVDGNLDNLSATKKYFFHTDHLGSTVAVTDEQGKEVWSSEYTPFGDKHSVTGELDHAARFTGKELDPDTGLYYFNARWYDSELGRFVSEDPALDPNNPNLYGYCSNNPLIHTDPTGMVQDENYWGDLWDTGVSAWNNFKTTLSKSSERLFNFSQGYGFKTISELGAEWTKEGKFGWANWEQELSHNISTEIGNYNFKGKSASEVNALKEKIANQELKEIQVKYSVLYNSIVPTYKSKLSPLYSKDSISEAFNAGLSVGIWSAALTNLGKGTGSLKVIEGGSYSASEIKAANYMKGLGNDVVLRLPIGTRVSGGTSDLIVNGINYDVYTPVTNNVSSIISSMAKKNSQTTGIVLDLAKTNVSAEQLGNALARVKGSIESQGKVCNIKVCRNRR
jgi:RHS repeat-associated protein